MHLDLKIHPIALSGPVVTLVGDPKQKTKWPKFLLSSRCHCNLKKRRNRSLFFSNSNNNVKRDFGHLVFVFWSPTFVMKQANIKLLLCPNFRKIIIILLVNETYDMRLQKGFDPIVDLELPTVKSTLNASYLMQFYVMLTVKLWSHPTTWVLPNFLSKFFSNIYMLVQFLTFVFFFQLKALPIPKYFLEICKNT